MTFTVEILNEHALNLLRELEEMRVIRLFYQRDQNAATTNGGKKKEFKAIRLDTRGLKFNREEANER